MGRSRPGRAGNKSGHVRYILDERLYAKRLTNQSLANTIELLPSAPLVADSAKPKSIAELAVLAVNALLCTKDADSVDFGIRHVQALRISYTATSKNLKEYESYAWMRNKGTVEEDDHLGIEARTVPTRLTSATCYFLTEMVRANADPEAKKRQRVRESRKVSTTRQCLAQNGAR